MDPIWRGSNSGKKLSVVSSSPEQFSQTLSFYSQCLLDSALFEGFLDIKEVECGGGGEQVLSSNLNSWWDEEVCEFQVPSLVSKFEWVLNCTSKWANFLELWSVERTSNWALNFIFFLPKISPCTCYVVRTELFASDLCWMRQMDFRVWFSLLCKETGIAVLYWYISPFSSFIFYSLVLLF